MLRMSFCDHSPSVVYCLVSVFRSHFQMSPLKLQARFQSNFMRSLKGQWERIIAPIFLVELLPLLLGQFYLYDYIFLQMTSSPKPHKGFQ